MTTDEEPDSSQAGAEQKSLALDSQGPVDRPDDATSDEEESPDRGLSRSSSMPFAASVHNDPAPPPPFEAAPFDPRRFGGGPEAMRPPMGSGFGPGPEGPQGGWTPFWRGQRLVDPRVTDADRIIAVLMHLWWVGLFVGGLPITCFLPVTLWAVRQSSSGFVDDHGREVINMQLTGLILLVSIVGAPIVPFWGVVCAVNSIRGAIAASQREHFRYGMIFRPIG